MKKLFLLLMLLSFSFLSAADNDPLSEIEKLAESGLPDFSSSDLQPPALPGDAVDTPKQKKEASPVQKKVAPTSVPTAVPTAVPTQPHDEVNLSMEPTATPQVLTPTPVVLVATPTVALAPKVKLVSSSIKASDYFVAQVGWKATYHYLKDATGKNKGNEVNVECTSVEAGATSTLATFKILDNGKEIEDVYRITENEIERIKVMGVALTGSFVLKSPAAAGARWFSKDKDGTERYYKAVKGTAHIYSKVYPDCIVVTEKSMKAGAVLSTAFYYYAKGVGLVGMEHYTKAMKLVQPYSLALNE